MVARVGAHGERVDARLHVGRRVHAETRVAVVPAAGLLSVHVNLRRGHHAVKVEEHRRARISRLQGERASVPAHALPRQFARAAMRRFVERTRDGPVMRHAHTLPARIVEVDRLGAQLARGVFCELPTRSGERHVALAGHGQAHHAEHNGRRGDLPDQVSTFHAASIPFPAACWQWAHAETAGAASCAPPMGTIVKGQSRSDSTSLQFRCVLASVHRLVH